MVGTIVCVGIPSVRFDVFGSRIGTVVCSGPIADQLVHFEIVEFPFLQSKLTQFIGLE
jgi:hypothetical protein